MAENMEGREGRGAAKANDRRSDVWLHFTRSKDGDGKDIATCKRCHKPLGAEPKNGTTHLKRHAKMCNNLDPEQTRGASDHNPESTLARRGNKRRLNQEEEFGLDVDELLPRMIAFHGYPSSIVEDECFGSLLRGLNPHFQMPSRATVEGICHRRAQEATNKLKEALACCSGHISLATGTVETGQGRALYMACQFIDDEWAFQKRIMQVFKVVRFPPYNHSALQGAEEVCLEMAEGVLKQFLLPRTSVTLEVAVRRWGLLPGRLCSVAWGQELEKCLERKDFLDGLCPFVQVGEGPTIEIPTVSCVNYTSDVLDSVGAKIHEALNPQYEDACFKAVKGLQLSYEKRTQNFAELELNHVGRYDKRWYSYYCALEVLHKEYSDNNAALMEHPKLDKSQILELFASKPDEIIIKLKNIVEQSKLKESVLTDLLRKILGTIYRAIETISSSSCPTANLCLMELMKLRAVLQSEAKDASTDIAKAVAYAKLGGFSGGKDAHVILLELQDVLDSYLKEAYLYLSIPTVLDPRFKLEYVSSILDEVYGPEAPAYISSVKGSIECIFKEHRRRKLRSNVNGEGTSSMTAGMIIAAEMDSECIEEENTNELERYLTDGLLIPREEGRESFNVLMWWKANSSRYPTVASMARDALAMPASDMLSPEHVARVRSMMSNYCVTYPQAPSDSDDD